MQTQALIEHLNAYLNAASFKDYAPNGLQVEGKPEIHRIVLGVSASQALIDHACSMGADCILVHHGWFWKGERSEVVGMKQRRLKALLKNDINLIAYHLPLDAHEEVGNNAEIARVLGLEIEQRAGSFELLCVGRPKDGSVPVEAFVERVAAAFGGIRVRVGEAGAEVRRVGWCSGAAQDELVEAASLGCDVYISGEISERTTYEARENGILYLACGHHATETLGIRALGRHIKNLWPELEIFWFDDENPV